MPVRTGSHQARPHAVIVAAHPQSTGGMERFGRFLARTLQQDGWHITVALSGCDIYTDTQIDPGRIEVNAVDWVDDTFAGDRRYTWTHVRRRCQWFRRVRPDLAIFIQSSNTPFRAGIAGAYLAGVPVVSTHRTMAWPVEESPVGRYCFGLVRGLGLHRRRVVTSTWLTAAMARFTVFNSRNVAMGYRDLYHYPAPRLRVIPNAVTLSSAARDATTTHPPGTPRAAHELRIGYVGRLSGEKRIDVLLRAVARMQHPSQVRVDLHGDGPSRYMLQTSAQQLGLADRTAFHGQCDDLDRAYRECDVVVLCSPRESSSNMILEAMAAGRPVVVTRAGGMPELIGEDQAGLCVDALDVGGLAQTLDRLAQDADLRDRLGRQGRGRARTHHDPARIAARWQALARQAAFGPGVAPQKQQTATGLYPGPSRLVVHGSAGQIICP